MRIMHVQPIDFSIFGHADSDWGSSVRYFLPNLATAQQRLGNDVQVHLLTSGRSRRTEAAGLPVQFHRCLQLPKRLPATARYGRQLSRGMLRAIRPGVADVIHLHGLESLHLMVGSVVRRANQAGIAVVAQEHATREPKLLEDILHRRQLRNIDVVLCSNQANVELFTDHGIDRCRIRVLRNGYDPEIFFACPVERREPPLHVIVLSRLVDDKDPLTMVEGIVGAARRGVNSRVTIIGTGPLRSRIEQGFAAAGIAADFIEHVDHRELGDLFRSADAFVLTSLKEGSNQAVVEAMASGLPVVVADTPGLSDVADDASITVPQRSADDVAQAITRLARDASFRAERSSASLRVAQSLTWDAIAADSMSIYEDALRIRSDR
jgi:glycosyltransferase involved in cell wall biosynthesis